MNADDDEMEITLPILQTIEQQSDITQRSLAKRLGFALGLTNSYLKHLIRKGLVKIEQIPTNRYLYYLTPNGFAEKSRLTAEYLSRSFSFYREASQSCRRLFKQCELSGKRSIILCGVSDLAEIALLHAGQMNIQITGIYNPNYKKNIFMQHEVWQSLEKITDGSVCIITCLKNPDEMLRSILQIVDEEHVLVPEILGINYKMAHCV